jgi:hypothetical protein
MLLSRMDTLDVKLLFQHQATLHNQDLFDDRYDNGVSLLTDCWYRVDTSVDRHPLDHNLFASERHIYQLLMFVRHHIDVHSSGFNLATLDYQFLGQQLELLLRSRRTIGRRAWLLFI